MNAWLLFLLLTSVAPAEDIASLCADRAALERVYYNHRLGEKPPFEETMPAGTLEHIIRLDLRKESTLREVYGVEITPAMVEAELERINRTTRAPEVLAEIRQALGDDPERFARSMARPIVVERELRHRFENDDRIHAAQRREAEQARAALLAQEPIEDLQEVTWQLTPRPAGEGAGAAVPAPVLSAPPPLTRAVAKSDAYAVEATAQLAQTLTPPREERDRKIYFEDLHPELAAVLQVQLQKPGDVSAVIETPRGFLVFLATERSSETLGVALLSLPKRSYDEWLRSPHPGSKP